MLDRIPEIRAGVIAQNFVTDSNKYGNHALYRGLGYYDWDLPEYGPFFNRKSYKSVLRAQVRKNSGARLLDLGCGAGMALMELRSEPLGGKLETWGVSGADFRNDWSKNNIDHYIIGDIHDPRTQSEIPADYFDVVVAFQFFRHLADPVAILQQSWNWLRKGQYGFIDQIADGGLPIYWQGLRIPNFLLAELLRNHGYNFQKDEGLDRRDNDLVFRKNKPNLDLPIEYSGQVESQGAPYENYDRMVYNWQGEMPKKMAARLRSLEERRLAFEERAWAKTIL